MIYKFVVKTDKDIVGQVNDIGRVYQIEEEKLENEFLSNFKWDKVNVCNIPQDNMIIYLSNNDDLLLNFRIGFLEAFGVVKMCLNAREQNQIYVENKC